MIVETLLVFLGIFVIAFVFAPIGLGGGLLFVPLLHYGLGWEIDGVLFAVSLSLTGVVSWGSGLAHRKENYVDDEVLKRALFGAIPGAITGVGIVFLLGDKLETTFKILSIAMIAWAIVRTTKQTNSKTLKTNSKTEKELESNRKNLLQFGTGIGGILSSVLAIGAGVIYVPVLRNLANLEPRKAIATSLNIMMVVVPIAVLTHFAVLSTTMRNQFFDEALLVLIFMFATLLGSRQGAAYGIKNLEEQTVMKIFIGIVVLVGIRYCVDVASMLLS